MHRAVRSSDWFAKVDLSNEELMKSREQTLGFEITRPLSHGEVQSAQQHSKRAKQLSSAEKTQTQFCLTRHTAGIACGDSVKRTECDRSLFVITAND